MDPITQQTALASAGAAGAGEGLYVDDVFSTYVYEGTGASQTITNDIDLSGEEGLVWIKRRDGTNSNLLYDTERGVNAYLTSNSNAGQYTASSQQLTSFNSDGFTVGTETYINNSGSKFTSWTFRKAPGFFDVVTYTGNGTAGRTVSHNLGSQPGMIVVKKLNSIGNWFVYHRSLGATKSLRLNLTITEDTSTTYFNDTEPTSTEFTVGTASALNGNGDSFVAYLFAHDDQSFGTASNESIIKCGSYTGNGSTQEINLGWEPQWVLIKSSAGTTTNWHVFDNMRGINAGGDDPALFPDLSNAENSSNNYFGKLTATGFDLTSTLNGSGNTYVYMAIRRPHKPPTAATEVFHVQTPREATDGTPSDLVYTSNFPVDLSINVVTTGSSLNGLTADRMRGNEYLLTNSTAAESNSIWEFDSNEGVYFNSARSIANDQCGFLFRRAPGFFDIVAYEGNATAGTAINHNLGVKPDLILVKRRDTSQAWRTYNSNTGPTKYQLLNNVNADVNNSGAWNGTEPTSTQFTIGGSSEVNTNGGDYIAYLFGSLDGISKFGSYTGTGGDIDIDCGFTNGARFVLVKRSDASGDWFVMDTARGITAGDDSYLVLNTSAAAVTNNSVIDPYSPGFQITDDAPAGLNASGGTYIYFAIA